ncbi:MAG: hypothetical protein KDD38_00960 [Bdellovibrionales bacterium]|nr:hypothetical protein [Bdellovibrionales bacterium]
MSTYFNKARLAKAAVTIIAVLSCSSSFAGGDGSGGSVTKPKAESETFGNRGDISQALKHAPKMMQLYMNFFENVEWGFSSGSGRVTREDLIEFVDGFVLKPNYRQYLSADRLKPQNEACLYTDPATKVVHKVIASTKNGQICFSIDLAAEENWSSHITQKKILNIYAHELAHIMGAGEDKKGEALAAMFGDYVETLIEDRKYYFDITNAVPSSDLLKNFLEDAKIIAEKTSQASSLTEVCMNAMALSHIIQGVQEAYFDNPYSSINTPLIDLKGVTKLQLANIRLYVVQDQCINGKSVAIGKKQHPYDLLMSGDYSFLDYTPRVRARQSQKVKELRKEYSYLYKTVDPDTKLDLISNLKNQIDRAWWEFILIEDDITALEKLMKND